jgi:biotin carboxyl carrier protein
VVTARVLVSSVDAAGPAGDAIEVSVEEEDRTAPLHEAVAAFTTPLPHRSGVGQRRAVEVVVGGWRFELLVEDAARAELRRRATRAHDAAEASGPTEIRAIIPGRIAGVRVAAGDAVELGDTLLVVEAMKMQNELRAPRAATVTRVAVGDGDTIETGDLLVVIE